MAPHCRRLIDTRPERSYSLRGRAGGRLVDVGRPAHGARCGGGANDMKPMRQRLALHTWTLETTPLADVLRIARETGWDAVELRRKDFERAFAAGWSTEQVLDLVRASGLPVAAVGVESGWLFAEAPSSSGCSRCSPRAVGRPSR